jgi:ribosomal protein S6--L-glutamate ligase
MMTKAPKFREFIAEAKTENKLRILCLSADPENSEYFHTAKRIKEEGPKLGHEVYIVFIDGAYIKNEDGVKTIHNEKDDKGFEINDTNTIAIVRGSITQKDSWQDLLSQLEKAGVSCINNRTCVNLCADKYRSYLRLADYGLVQPHTVLIPNKKGVETAFENLDRKYPIIMKTLRGSKGVGVIFIESERSLDAIVQLIYKESDDAELLIQEYIKTDYDVRVLVLGGKVLASMRRDVIKGDFRSNFSRGGKVKMFKLTEQEVEDCILAAKAVNGHYVAVDFIPAKNRDNDRPYIIEVNSSPGTEGIESATGDNLIKQVIQHFEDPAFRIKTPAECGYREVVNIKPFGDIVAKFDTGNSGTNVIHAEKTKVSGKNITWTLYGKTITSRIIKKIKISVGGLRNYDEERYKILLDVEFMGTVYTEVEFTLDNREGRQHVLLDREFMNRLNVMVNPSRRFVVTTKYSLD